MVRIFLALAAAALPAGAVHTVLTQESSGRSPLEPADTCDWRGLYREDVCRWKSLRVAGIRFGEMGLKRRGIVDIEKLKRNLWVMLRDHPTFRLEFFEVFDELSKLHPADVLATKETWVQADTDALHDLLPDAKLAGPDGPMELTTENMRKRLPSINDLKKMIVGKSLALVGNAKTLKLSPYGSEIDSKDHVVRFHGNVGNVLNATSTGTKQTMHVVNAKAAGHDEMPLFDLDSDHLMHTYCSRVLDGADHPRKWNAPVFMISPTGSCRLPRKAGDFTKPFLFYWFVGSLYDDVTVYGMMDNSTATYVNNEGFLKAEQAFMKQAAYQWVTPEEDLQLRRGPKPEFRVRM